MTNKQNLLHKQILLPILFINYLSEKSESVNICQTTATEKTFPTPQKRRVSCSIFLKYGYLDNVVLMCQKIQYLVICQTYTEVVSQDSGFLLTLGQAAFLK